MIGQYYNVGKSLRYGMLVFFLPQIPYYLYTKTVSPTFGALKEVTRSYTTSPFNVKAEGADLNALGRPKQYSGDAQQWTFGRI